MIVFYLQVFGPHVGSAVLKGLTHTSDKSRSTVDHQVGMGDVVDPVSAVLRCCAGSGVDPTLL